MLEYANEGQAPAKEDIMYRSEDYATEKNTDNERENRTEAEFSEAAVRAAAREKYVLFSAAILTLLGFIVMIVGNAAVPSVFLSKDKNMNLSKIVSTVRKSFPPVQFYPEAQRDDRFSDRSPTEGLDGNENPDEVYEIPEDSLPVLALTMVPPETLLNYGGVYINNEPGKSIDLKKMTESDFALGLETNASEPQVLVYHTHGTESYNVDGLPYYGDEFYSVNSDDIEKNVVRVGTVLCAALEAKGIKTLHNVTMYDENDYNNAYALACTDIEKILKEYPSIKLVIDLHRDTVVTSNGTKYRPVTETKYGTTAQIMLLIGSGKSAAPNPHWEKNLLLAVKLQQAGTKYESFMRQIFLRATRYNQHLSEKSILVEVGTCGNSLEEAENAAKLLADVIEELNRQ